MAHTEKLTESTINANARFFEKKEDVPTMAITMGMGDILAAKKSFWPLRPCKVPPSRGLIMDDVITTQNPSTMLKMHEDAVVVIDRELARRRGLQSLTPTAEKRRCSGPPPGNRSGPLCFSPAEKSPCRRCVRRAKTRGLLLSPQISCSASFEACRKGALKIDFYLYSG